MKIDFYDLGDAKATITIFVPEAEFHSSHDRIALVNKVLRPYSPHSLGLDWDFGLDGGVVTEFGGGDLCRFRISHPTKMEG